jgi:hypothetical protein
MACSRGWFRADGASDQVVFRTHFVARQEAGQGERGSAPDASSVARTTWEMIENMSIRAIKDGKVFKDTCDAFAYLTQAAERLLAEKLEILKVLGV